MHRLEHKGDIGHKTGDNITVHVLSMIDDSSKYKTIDGVLHVKDVNLVNGKYQKEERYITMQEHNSRHYPKIKNPLDF
jgi:hypothetical protein